MDILLFRSRTPVQHDLFDAPIGHAGGVAAAADIEAVLRHGAPVFLCVSGGKDGQAMAYATTDHLERVGHAGPRLLIHSDLGRVEWRDSLPVCERLAARLGLELVVVRREAGDMMDRWLSRWSGNVARYASLECVKLILPWSTPSTRFCTSELKGAVISRAIRRRFPHGDVVSALGLRREESSARAKAPVWKHDERTTRRHGRGYVWHPIIDWRVEDVFAGIEAHGDEPHEAYGRYGSTRASCAFCIMGSERDLRASARCVDHAEIYREMVALEIRSTFAFQSARWLGDVAPELLDASTRQDLLEAKERAAMRQAAEARLPAHLLFTKGWPTVVPTVPEARLLASVRQDVASAVGLDVGYLDADAIRARYTTLLANRAMSEGRSGGGSVSMGGHSHTSAAATSSGELSCHSP